MRSCVRLSNYMHLKYCTVSKNPDPEYYKREVKRRKVEVRKMYNVQYTGGISHSVQPSGQPSNHFSNSRKGKEIFLFSQTFRPDLGYTQPPTQ